MPNCVGGSYAGLGSTHRKLGIDLLGPLPAGGLYTSVVVDGLIAYTSGIVAVEGPPLHLVYAGCVGDDVSLEDGRLSARGAVLSTLGNLRGALGSLDRVERFLKMTGYVRAVPGFERTPAVMDGASELLRDIFGADLLPARAAVGVSALPGGASVEVGRGRPADGLTGARAHRRRASGLRHRDGVFRTVEHGPTSQLRLGCVEVAVQRLRVTVDISEAKQGRGERVAHGVALAPVGIDVDSHHRTSPQPVEFSML